MSSSRCAISFFISLFWATNVFSVHALEDSLVALIPQVVKISGHASRYAPKEERSSWTGTGFVYDAERGRVLTNHHVVPTSTCASYEAELMDGTIINDVRILASSGGAQFGDWTLLEIPELAGHFQQMTIDPEFQVKMQDKVAFMGNSNGHFSIETGLVNVPYSYWTEFRNRGVQSFKVHINHKGGASGSPVFNDKGSVIGILFAGDEEHAMVLPIWYVHVALQKLEKKESIVAYTLGVSFCSLNINSLRTYNGISVDFFKPYLGNPDEKKELLWIKPSDKSSKDENCLQVNDVLLNVNDQKIGANSIILTKELMKDQLVTLQVLRLGQIKTLEMMPQKIHSSFTTFLWGHDFSIRSCSSSLANIIDAAQEAPLFAINENDGYFLVNAVGSPVTPRIQVQTFDDFVRAFHEIIAIRGKRAITLDMHDVKLAEKRKLKTIKFPGNFALEFFVHRFDYEKHQWVTYEYAHYVKLITDNIIEEF